MGGKALLVGPRPIEQAVFCLKYAKGWLRDELRGAGDIIKTGRDEIHVQLSFAPPLLERPFLLGAKVWIVVGADHGEEEMRPVGRVIRIESGTGAGRARDALIIRPSGSRKGGAVPTAAKEV